MKVFIGDPCYALSRDDYFSTLNFSYWCDDLDDGSMVHPDRILNRPDNLSDEDIADASDEFYDSPCTYERFGNAFPYGPDGKPLDSVKIASTWIGDGVYGDQDGYSYPVDSGQLGMVPEHLWNREGRNTEESLSHYGRVVELDEMQEWFLIDLQANGTLALGPVTIPTGPADFAGNIIPDEEDE